MQSLRAPYGRLGRGGAGRGVIGRVGRGGERWPSPSSRLFKWHALPPVLLDITVCPPLLEQGLIVLLPLLNDNDISSFICSTDACSRELPRAPAHWTCVSYGLLWKQDASPRCRSTMRTGSSACSRSLISPRGKERFYCSCTHQNAFASVTY